MKTFIGLIRFFIRNSQVRIQREMMYRANYISGTIITMTYSSVPAIFQYLIFTQTKGFPGWNLEQILMFQGMLLLVAGIQSTLFGELREVVGELVRKGDFDRLLLKPYPPIGTILASGFKGGSTGTLLTGGILIVTAAVKMGLRVSPIQIGLFVICLICGLIFYASINIFYCAIMLMVISMGGIWDLIQRILNLSQYPKEIFPKAVQIIIVTVAPFMVMVYFPTQVLLNRVDITIIYALIASFTFLLISIVYWNSCLKKYTSAGG